MFLDDDETALDLLNVDVIVGTIIQLVQKAADRPLTIGVHGDWGAGKSSVLAMIEEELQTVQGVECVRFNGWLFQGFEDAKLVLIERIVQEIMARQSTSAKMIDRAKSVLRRVDWLKVAKKTGGLAFTAATGMPTPDLVASLQNLVQNPTQTLEGANLEKMLDQAGRYLKQGDNTNVPHEIHAFRKDFEALLNEVRIDKLVILIDDLDRCLPETAIETLEAIRLFLFVPRSVFVLATDEPMIEYAVRKHYPDLPPSSGPQSYPRNYLEKLIQVPFRLPTMGQAELRSYIALLLVEQVTGRDDQVFKDLLAASKEQLRRPWSSPSLSLEKTELPESVNEAFALAAILTPQLTEGSKGNPRQVKRFLNTLLLRVEIASALGFKDEVRRDVLAKLMLAERFNDTLYQELQNLALSSSDGKLEILYLAEGQRSSEPMSDPEIMDTPEPKESLPEWLKDEWSKRWATTKPYLSAVDLRPYFFVSRDKRLYFGGGTSSHLEAVLESLMGARMAVMARRSEVQQLNPGDAKKLADTIQERISVNGQLDRLPQGIEGLKLLAELFPTLQNPLVAFLAGLPTADLGNWAATGWERTFTEAEAKATFESLQLKWEQQEENPRLKRAAETARRLSARRRTLRS